MRRDEGGREARVEGGAINMGRTTTTTTTAGANDEQEAGRAVMHPKHYEAGSAKNGKRKG